ncbi:MAG: ATP-binding cassette domain-containing protein [Actinomycetota bacterium]|nr:ATP-binding cassette domain-containing protein [Actinomycetota bacterium]
MSAPLLGVDQVSKAFGRVIALDRVSFTVAAGETVGLVGGSGAGKSTVARLVSGLVDPDAGTIRVDGHDLAGLSRAQRRAVRRRVHLVFQDPYASLPPGRRVADIVAEPLVIHRVATGEERRRRVLDALAEVALSPERYAARFPHELSGGERQRVALARAVVLRPELIIADEPTAMLDASTRAGLLRLLADLRAVHGVAYLYITHDLALADGFCDRLVVLRHGQVVEQGLTAEVLGRPAHPYTAALVDAVHQLQPAAWSAGGTP